MRKAPLIKREQGYKVVMSSGDRISIEEEELTKVLQGSAAKGLIVVKQGAINPAHIVNIVNDADRMKEYRDACKNGAPRDDGTTEGEWRKSVGMEPLKTIFRGEIYEKLRASAFQLALQTGLQKNTLPTLSQNHDSTQ